jgi:hypothetical protein
MSARWLFVAVVLSIAAVIPNAHAQGGNSGAKAKDPALQVAIEARQKAISTRNTTEWTKYTADEFVLLTADGTMQNRSERMKYLATNPGNANPTPVASATMFGPGAAVVIQQNPAAANPTRTTTFWVRQGGSWKVVTTVMSPYKAK